MYVSYIGGEVGAEVDRLVVLRREARVDDQRGRRQAREVDLCGQLLAQILRSHAGVDLGVFGLENMTFTGRQP